jgi:hypothetical protein
MQTRRDFVFNATATGYSREMDEGGRSQDDGKAGFNEHEKENMAVLAGGPASKRGR